MSVVYDEPPTRRTPSGKWLPRLMGAVAGIALVGAAAISITGYQHWTMLPGAPTMAAAQSDPQVASIQSVIQKANSEQVLAVAAHDASVMADSGTSAYDQQMSDTNQQLAAEGVTAIQLTNLSWGPVAVDGSNATATTSETWVTTFGDGTTLQSTDTNVYSLVEQNGSWLISDDQQPTAAQASGPSPTNPSPGQPGQPQTTAPGTGVDTSSSRNWSGYVATNKTYTAVSGTWTVPQPSSTSATGVGATWVGIGGVDSRDLIQAGTQDVASGTGQSQFQAWIETLPQASQQIPLAVAPGDSVSVSITESSPGSGAWTIAFKNNTSGQSYQRTVRYTSSQSSAEWIEEAPATGNGIVPLDNFGTIPFSGATAVANGETIDLSQAGAQPVTMANASGQALAVPSTIGSDGSTFSVARTSASATPAPAAPRGRAFGR